MKMGKFGSLAKVNFPRTKSLSQHVPISVKLVPAFLFALVALTPLSFGQELDPLGSGNPSAYSLQDLPNSMVAVEVSTTKDSLRTLMTLSYGSMGTIRGEGQQSGLTPEVLMQLADVIWTSKDLTMGNNDHLIGYKLDMPANYRIVAQPSELRFRITYIKRSAIVSLTPRGEYGPAEMKELAKGETKLAGTQAQRTATLSNLKQISTAFQILLADSEDMVPYVQGTPQLFKLMEPYTKNSELFKTLNPAGGTFRFNMSLAGVDVTDVNDPSKVVLFWETEPWADGKRCVAYVDSHAKVVSPEEWAALQPTLQLKLKRHGKPLPPDSITPQVK